MKFSVSNDALLNQKSDVVFVFVTKGDEKNPPVPAFFKSLDKKLAQTLSDQLKSEKFKGDADESKTFFVKGQLASSYLVIVGLGDNKKITLETLRKAGAKIQAIANGNKAKQAGIEIDTAVFGKFSYNEVAQALTEGAALSAYQFTRYKKAKESTLEKIIFHTAKSQHKKQAEAGAERAQILSEAVCLARDLVNSSGADVTPKVLADTAEKCSGVKVKIHDLAAIKKLKMGAFLSVAHGSTVNPPYFIEMHYKPKSAKKKVALIGKGVTFDSGGYSLKPAKSMENMKDDMAAAAAVIAFMSVIHKLKPNVEVSAYVAATENMIDGGAQRPGDVCTAMNGKTIEVLNTDAEGRLTLADALHYAAQDKPDYMIDMATLTGACLVSLGLLYSGIMGNDQKLINALIDSGKSAGENIWHLPLPEEYKPQLKSDIADFKNIGGAYGGTLTAGLFLQEFVGETKWAHIDIAGPSFTESPLPYTPKGGSGVMVRTLAHFLDQI